MGKNKKATVRKEKEEVKKPTNVPKSRKDIRKEKRLKKKINRREHYGKNKRFGEPGALLKKFVPDSDSDNDTTKEKSKDDTNVKLKNKNKPSEDDLLHDIRSTKRAENKLKMSMEKHRNSRLLKANEAEDNIIKKLEKQLKMNKKKGKKSNLPKSFKSDGLDYLLEVCDKNTVGKCIPAENPNDSDGDFEDDFDIVTSKKKMSKDEKKKSDKKIQDHIMSDDNSDMSDDDEDQFGSDDESEEDLDDNDGFSDEDFGDGDGTDDEKLVYKGEEKEGNDESEGFSDEDGYKSDKEKIVDDMKEDIYGRKRDKDGNVITEETQKYVPPHLRFKASNTESQEAIHLKKQIKGLLNKVAGANMYWTSTQIEKLYMKNSRNLFMETFCKTWMEAIVKPIITSDRLAIEYAMLVALLHANTDSEIGVFFLQDIVKKFSRLISSEQTLENKELENLILGISQLYSFKIYQSTLIYEILGKLIENLTEKHIDCLLISFRNVGDVLRKEDPLALKTFIQKVQEKGRVMKDCTETSRLRIDFLLDVLLAIKNNNMNKIPQYDPTYTEELKKSLKGIIRKGNRIITINIPLDDLLKADEHGKWWFVGSAWKGEPKKETAKKAKIDANETDDNQQAYLLQLADNQRINTDLRRNIFCTIMSADDYVDAFEKLVNLDIKGQQQREIMHILLSCCLQEKVFNPYYAALGQKFCDTDRKYQMSIQYTVWDKIKELENCKIYQISNLAQFLSTLFLQKSLPISVLKVIQFSELTKRSMRLMRQILLRILLHKNTQICMEVFQRIELSPKLHLFRESLRLFISCFLLKSINSKDNLLNDKQKVTLQERCEAVDRALQKESKLKF